MARTMAGAIAEAPAAARLRARLLGLAIHLPALLFLLMVLSPPLNHDVAAVLNFSERWFAGERLYIDLIDVNPPLIFSLNLIPAAIAAWTPLDGVQALQLCLLVLAGLSVRLCLRLREGRAEGAVEAAVLTGLLPLAVLVVGYDFGQREVLMGTVALPYALLAVRRMEGQRTGRGLWLGTTLLAALGFALKPHFLAVPLLVEALVLLRRGPRRALRDPAPWAMAAVWLAYLAAIPLIFPAYLGYVVPLVWQYYLDLGGQSAWAVLLTPNLAVAAALLLVLVPLSFRATAGGLARVLAAAALGAFLSAWVQHKGWTYHVAPVLMLGGVLAGLLAARAADSVLPLATARRAAPGLALLATAGLALFALRGGEAPFREIGFEDSKAGRLTAWLKQQAYGERLLIISPDIYPVYPALNYAHVQSTLRTMNMWLLQGVYRTCPENGERYRQPWEMSRAEFFVYRTVAEDFAKAPPAAVLIDRNPGIPWCGREFDFAEYFSRHPLFAATWRHYHQEGEIEGYRLYVRDN
ncbi:hypothetical protein MVG78_11215 [Roseomonas gilardii subsp. gilardii]|uniref:hypothetical protein n=1 Tax=Roseomonas gilardii TaxID=257708 RepID=UPI001FF80717|nr:hypothetical protein [Roseomonas gilardii]UPG71174.1 hypothetical protein MVG78_11215 [Roseomonas gilardii subsp. gilardii]